MLLKNIPNKVFKGVPLRLVLVVPFVLQIFAAVGLTGYFSLRNGQQAIDDLAQQLLNKASKIVDQHLDTYLATPAQISRSNTEAVEVGLLDLKNYQKAGRFFWKQIQIFNASYISYALTTGEFVGAGSWLAGQGVTVEEISSNTKGKSYTYATDNQGNRTQLVHVYDYKPLVETWYTQTVKTGKPVWSEVYAWTDSRGSLAISTNYPIYNNTRKLIGVMSVDLLLSKISAFLRNLKISSLEKTFIVERNGLLIASSSNEKPFTIVNGEAQRLSVLNSSDPLIRATARYLQQKFGSLREIKNNFQLDFLLQGERQFVHVEPWRDKLGLDWLVIVVVPETDFMGQINGNTRMTIILCLVALLTATILGLMTSYWIIKPIQRLSAASQAIANGDLDQSIEVKGINELGVLSQSFNEMALQLRESFEQLETKVEQRTIELNAAKKVAESSNHAKTEFLANMSHELRTPLNVILGFTQLMNHDPSLTLEQQENLEIINHSGEHLLSLINNVLDMSKIEVGHSTLNENDFDLYHLLDTVEEMFHLRAESQGLQLIFEKTLEVPQYVRSDESKLRQILINLLGNAIKFTQEGGVVLRMICVAGQLSVASTKKQLILHFEVEDTGVGIAPDETESLFEAFVQTQAGRKAQQGTGLGLPISRKFVQLMGGDITVSSKLGQGTIFKFDIQVEPVESADVQTAKKRRVIGLAPGQPKYRILVADDSWENRLLLSKLLTSIGLQVHEAENGQEAIAVWESWQPHLIWMDMRMPIMNGYEAVKQIKSHLRGQATVVIALTASTFEEERATVLSAGCDDFVRKPFREEVIWEKMAQYLGVRYVYEDLASVSAEPMVSEELTREALFSMPIQWLAQMHQAASQLDTQLTSQLIAQIPEEHSCLAKALQKKVSEFDFDQIMNLTRHTGKL